MTVRLSATARNRIRVFVATFSPALAGVALGMWTVTQGGWVATACAVSIIIASKALDVSEASQ